ncbi:MAG: hypothetical protein R3B13_22090 [Polyangiaceae bacterium]
MQDFAQQRVEVLSVAVRSVHVSRATAVESDVEPPAVAGANSMLPPLWLVSLAAPQHHLSLVSSAMSPLAENSLITVGHLWAPSLLLPE